MAHTVPAKSVDKAPQYQFAVLAVRREAEVAELESSFVDQWQAENMFERQYSKWGLTDTNFYLVDWRKQAVLKAHEVWHK